MPCTELVRLANIISVSCIGLTVIYVSIGLTDYFKYDNKEFIWNFTRCDNVAQLREVYQHGDFWVLRNFVRAAKQQNFDCNTDVTVSMQGGCEDIYQLKQLYMADGVTYKSLTSFAVYIPNVDADFNRTLAAIAYVRNCVYILHSSTGSRGRRRYHYVYYIKDYVNFHLYLHAEQAFNLIYMSNIDLFVETREYCGQVQPSTVVDSTYSEESAEQQQLAIIVGRNIAQLAATTKFIICSDAQTYTSSELFQTMLHAVDKNISQYANLTDRIAFYLPLILVHNMTQLDHQIRRQKKDLIFHMQQQANRFQLLQADLLNTICWLQADCIMFHRKLESGSFLEALLAYPSYFLATSALPLLPEHLGLSASQSELLRVYEMLSQGYKFFLQPDIYMVHNIAEEAELYEHFTNDTNEAFCEEHKLIYGNLTEIEADELSNILNSTEGSSSIMATEASTTTFSEDVITLD